MFGINMILTLFMICSVEAVLLNEGDRCDMNGVIGTCKLQNKCNDTLEFIKKNITPKLCRFSGLTPVICCTHQNVTDRIEVENMIKDAITTKCKHYQDLRNDLFGYKDCFPYRINNRREFYCPMYDSLPAETGEFPHMTALGYGNRSNIDWNCGGSLISENYVLTAAHCLFTRYGDVKYVQLGVEFLWHSDYSTSQLYNVIEKTPHPEYKPPSSYHDIALLKLDQNILFSYQSVPICLPTSNIFPNELIATGWGLTEYGNRTNQLQKGILESFPFDECARNYKLNARKLSRGIDSNTQICFGSKTDITDTCKGDSGGPLHYKSGPLYTIVGITSFGKGCGTPGLPAVYTNVYPYIKWITNIVWP